MSTLHFERRLAAPIERAWRAISDPAELDRWFVATVPWTPAVGETFDAGGREVRVTEVDAPRVLAWSVGEERYRFELLPDGDDACVLRFDHRFDPSFGSAEQHSEGWTIYLGRLDVHLAGGHVSEADAHALHRGVATLEEPRTLRFVRRLEHPVERVWEAITDPGELERWFPGGAPMEVTEQAPPRVLVATWFGDVLRFELTPDRDGCVLVFTHAIADGATAARDAAGWDRCFARLDASLDGEPMSEADSLRAWPEVHERYAEAFGADPEVGRRAFAAHPQT